MFLEAMNARDQGSNVGLRGNEMKQKQVENERKCNEKETKVKLTNLKN